jgi:predicted LPLAT superfamily acyltransferase
MTRTASLLRDAGMAAQLALAAGVSWVVPESLWLPLTRAAGRVEALLNSPRSRAWPIDHQLGAAIGCSARALALERASACHASRLYSLREYLPGRRSVPVRLDGIDELAGALAAGTGAVLWVSRFAWASLITKIGLHQAGFAVSHLSRPGHPFGDSAFRVRWLNPVWTRIEARFLRERIVLDPRAETAALRMLRRRLAEGGAVSITVGHEAVRTVGASVLGVPLRLSTGPMHLAVASGAPLIPVFSVRNGEGAFVVTLDAPLRVEAGAERDTREHAIAAEYASRLEPWVRQYPGQWLGE